MKDRITIADNRIIFKAPSKLTPLIIFTVGVVSLMAGLYFRGQLSPVDHLLIGAGIILMSGEILFFLNTRYLKIVINEEPGYISILESSFSAIRPIRIPLDYYKTIAIQHSMSEDAAQYDILLVNRFGAAMLITSYNNLSQAIDMGKRLQQIMNIDLTSTEEFFTTLGGRSAASTSVAMPALEPTPTLNCTRDGNTSLIIWNNAKSLPYYILTFGILYGFFHILHHAVIPHTSPVAGYILLPLLGLIGILLIITMLMSILGNNYLRISPDGITYFTGIFGKKFAEKEMKRSSIGFFKNSLSQGSSTMQIVSNEGIVLLKKMMSRLEKQGSPDMTMLSEMMALKSEIIDVNVSSLTMADRLYLEAELIKILR